MKKNVNRILAMAAAAAVLAGIAVVVRTEFGPSSHPATFAAPAGGGMMDSSKYVSASVAGHGQRAELTLHIAADWHVNAHPASLDYLSPRPYRSRPMARCAR